MISKNAVALVILALSTIGINVAEAELIEAISAIGTIVSFALMFINQWQRRDIDGFFFKK